MNAQNYIIFKRSKDEVLVHTVTQTNCIEWTVFLYVQNPTYPNTDHIYSGEKDIFTQVFHQS